MTARMTNKTDIGVLRALLAKATPGPWKTEVWAHEDVGFAAVGPIHDDESYRGDNEPHGPNETAALHDADLIANVISALPALLDELEAARAVVEVARKQAEYWVRADELHGAIANYDLVTREKR